MFAKILRILVKNPSNLQSLAAMRAALLVPEKFGGC
jgi:hypothetical protein